MLTSLVLFLLSSRLYGWMSWTFSLASDVYGSPLSMLYALFDVFLSDMLLSHVFSSDMLFVLIYLIPTSP